MLGTIMASNVSVCTRQLRWSAQRVLYAQRVLLHAVWGVDTDMIAAAALSAAVAAAGTLVMRTGLW